MTTEQKAIAWDSYKDALLRMIQTMDLSNQDRDKAKAEVLLLMEIEARVLEATARGQG